MNFFIVYIYFLNYIIVELEILHVRRPFLHLVFVLSEGAHLTFRMHFGCIRCCMIVLIYIFAGLVCKSQWPRRPSQQIVPQLALQYLLIET